jgi:gliding motility-associated-like protein
LITLPTKKIAIQMKVSLIMVFLWVELISIFNGTDLKAQVGRGQPSVEKSNFTSFTRKFNNRGKFWMTRNKAYLGHPDANFGDRYSPDSNAVELFEKRMVDYKFFINKNSPSIFYSQKSSGALHFKKNGQWITIDTRLSPKGPFIFEASNQEHPLGFDMKRKSSYIITADGRTYFNNWKLYGDNGHTESLLATADWTNYSAGDDGILIKNIFPGIDAEMKLSAGSIETNFIVHANKFPAYKTLLLRDSFLNGHSGNFSFSGGLPGNGLTASADFRVSASTGFHVKEGVMYQKENPSSTYRFIPYFLDHNKLTLAINADFFNILLKMGDVVIDPLVQDMAMLKKKVITGSHSNQNCSLDTACQYDFVVPAPPGATLIDATFSFGFNADAPCVGQDGAFSFAINGGCVSRKWVGTAAGTGQQNFTNQSITLNNGAGLAGCFPSPVCGPQNIPFSFYFFRKCHGPQGCDGSCIEASKDLMITLEGRTFDSASLVATPPNSCSGSPVTLTARGYYGVAPYNFTWPGLPQYFGDSVIQVRPNNNAVYTVQVSSACPGPGNGQITKSVTVNVVTAITPTVTISSSNTNICAGAQVSFTATALFAGNSPTYQWLVNNKKAGTNSPQFAASNFANNDAVSCMVSASGPCAGTSALSNIIVVTVTGRSPTFDAIGPLCQNSTAPILPPTSKEGIAGTWSPAIISTSSPGTLTYKFTPTTTAGQCGITSQMAIVVTPLPGLIMGPDRTIVAGASTAMNVSVTGNIVSYKWSPSVGLDDPNTQDPVASPTSTTVYTLNIVDDNNCETSGSIRITVSSGTGTSKISVPNAFSPNGDGINDTWVITNLSANPGATVDVYNRYGQLVFHSDNANKAWDGTLNGNPLPLGTYYYVIDLKDNEKKIAGSVTIFK